jgi:hypothetical protein
MRALHTLWPTALATLACAILATGGAIEACSSTPASETADAATLTDGGPVATDGGDASAPVDATISDATDGAPVNPADGAPVDAADSGLDATTAVDSALPPLPFGIDAT